jgi:hypothetical protein
MAIVETQGIFGKQRVFFSKKIGGERILKRGEAIVLDYSKLKGHVLGLLTVLADGNIKYTRQIKSKLVEYETDTPDKINQMKIRTGRIWQRVYTYQP